MYVCGVTVYNAATSATSGTFVATTSAPGLRYAGYVDRGQDITDVDGQDIQQAGGRQDPARLTAEHIRAFDEVRSGLAWSGPSTTPPPPSTSRR